MEGEVTGMEEAEQVEDIPVERSRVAQRTSQEEPSTSSGVQIDRASQPSHEVSQGLYCRILYTANICILAAS